MFCQNDAMAKLRLLLQIWGAIDDMDFLHERFKNQSVQVSTFGAHFLSFRSFMHSIRWDWNQLTIDIDERKGGSSMSPKFDPETELYGFGSGSLVAGNEWFAILDVATGIGVADDDVLLVVALNADRDDKWSISIPVCVAGSASGDSPSNFFTSITAATFWWATFKLSPIATLEDCPAFTSSRVAKTHHAAWPFRISSATLGRAPNTELRDPQSNWRHSAARHQI